MERSVDNNAASGGDAAATLRLFEAHDKAACAAATAAALLRLGEPMQQAVHDAELVLSGSNAVDKDCSISSATAAGQEASLNNLISQPIAAPPMDVMREAMLASVGLTGKDIAMDSSQASVAGSLAPPSLDTLEFESVDYSSSQPGSSRRAVNEAELAAEHLATLATHVIESSMQPANQLQMPASSIRSEYGVEPHAQATSRSTGLPAGVGVSPLPVDVITQDLRNSSTSSGASSVQPPTPAPTPAQPSPPEAGSPREASSPHPSQQLPTSVRLGSAPATLNLPYLSPTRRGSEKPMRTRSSGSDELGVHDLPTQAERRPATAEAGSAPPSLSGLRRTPTPVPNRLSVASSSAASSSAPSSMHSARGSYGSLDELAAVLEEEAISSTAASSSSKEEYNDAAETRAAPFYLARQSSSSSDGSGSEGSTDSSSLPQWYSTTASPTGAGPVDGFERALPAAGGETAAGTTGLAGQAMQAIAGTSAIATQAMSNGIAAKGTTPPSHGSTQQQRLTPTALEALSGIEAGGLSPRAGAADVSAPLAGLAGSEVKPVGASVTEEPLSTVALQQISTGVAAPEISIGTSGKAEPAAAGLPVRQTSIASQSEGSNLVSGRSVPVHEMIERLHSSDSHASSQQPIHTGVPAVDAQPALVQSIQQQMALHGYLGRAAAIAGNLVHTGQPPARAANMAEAVLDPADVVDFTDARTNFQCPDTVPDIIAAHRHVIAPTSGSGELPASHSYSNQPAGTSETADVVRQDNHAHKHHHHHAHRRHDDDVLFLGDQQVVSDKQLAETAKDVAETALGTDKVAEIEADQKQEIEKELEQLQEEQADEAAEQLQIELEQTELKHEIEEEDKQEQQVEQHASQVSAQQQQPLAAIDDDIVLSPGKPTSEAPPIDDENLPVMLPPVLSGSEPGDLVAAESRNEVLTASPRRERSSDVGPNLAALISEVTSTDPPVQPHGHASVLQPTPPVLEDDSSDCLPSFSVEPRVVPEQPASTATTTATSNGSSEQPAVSRPVTSQASPFSDGHVDTRPVAASNIARLPSRLQSSLGGVTPQDSLVDPSIAHIPAGLAPLNVSRLSASGRSSSLPGVLVTGHPATSDLLAVSAAAAAEAGLPPPSPRLIAALGQQSAQEGVLADEEVPRSRRNGLSSNGASSSGASSSGAANSNGATTSNPGYITSPLAPLASPHANWPTSPQGYFAPTSPHANWPASPQ